MDFQTHAPSSAITMQRRRIVLPSETAYDLIQITEDGVSSPKVLGAGRFAKVFAAQQVIAGQPSRSVAIKILHDRADYHAERLFDQEVALNREFSTGPTQGVPPLLDIIHLECLVVCGCGALYHPNCPRGCDVKLQRRNLKTRPYPALHCSKCDYELSAERVDQNGGELYSHKAKPCCTKKDDLHADVGTIVNFALRKVMVMECLEVSLADYARNREGRALVAEQGPFEHTLHYFGLTSERSRLEVVDQKVRLLGKVNLMVQIGETVAWLHGEKKVVHKDLAPDNIMLRHAPCDAQMGGFGGDHLAARLDQAANSCAEIRVIDFGLSDKEKLTRAWYEDAETSMAVTKLPYLSPESRNRVQSIGVSLEFDAALSRFRVPGSLDQSIASIRMHDIIADGCDDNHAQDMVITRIEEESGQQYAYFEGNSPKNLSRHLEIVRPLAEGHDVYALGAILYYVLTGRHDQVEKLSNLAALVQDDEGCPLDQRHLSRRDNYAKSRNSIREPFWRDELMIVIFRAMVRGRKESFVADRTVRGPEPAQRFLTELKYIQQGLMAEVFAERGYLQRARVRRSAAAAMLLVLLTFSAFALFGNREQTSQKYAQETGGAMNLTASTPSLPAKEVLPQLVPATTPPEQAPTADAVPPTAALPKAETPPISGKPPRPRPNGTKQSPVVADPFKK